MNSKMIQRIKPASGRACRHQPGMVVLALCLIVALGNGCAATSSIATAGVTQYRLTPKRVGVTPSGDVVIEADLTPYKEKWMSVRTQPSRKRYIVGSAEILEASTRECRWPCQRDGDRIHLPVRIVKPSDTGWHMLPYHRQPVDATAADLPPNLAEHVPGLTFSERNLQQTLGNGETVRVGIGQVTLPNEMSAHTAWWHCPAQVLLVPAFFVDLIMFPVQLNQLSKQF